MHVGVLFGQTASEFPPTAPAVFRAPNGKLCIGNVAVFGTDFRNYINRVRFMRVNTDREPKARGKFSRNVLPLPPCVVASIDATVILLEESLGC